MDEALSVWARCSRPGREVASVPGVLYHLQGLRFACPIRERAPWPCACGIASLSDRILGIGRDGDPFVVIVERMRLTVACGTATVATSQPQ